MQCAAIGCTHGSHKEVKFDRSGDLLIHTGDIGGRTTGREILDFMDWFGRQPFTYKVFIAGNHDAVLEDFRPTRLPPNTFYVQDQLVECEGKRIWGSPYTPTFFNWHFMKDRGTELKVHWDQMPSNLDLLITHGPPHNILDDMITGRSVGDKDLRDAVELKLPKVHVFSHIHEGYGQKTVNHVHYINCSIMDEDYVPINKPIYFTI